MTNPAADLAKALATYDLKSTTPVIARGGRGSGDSAFWREQGRLVGLLQSIDRELEGLHSAGIDVQPFNEYVPEWYRSVFSFHRAWNAQVNGAAPAIDLPALHMLRALAALLGSASNDRDIPASVAKSLESALDDAFTLLERDRQMFSSLEVRYLYSLLEGARSMLGERSVVGEVDLQAKLDQISGAMVRIGQQLAGHDPDKSNGWFHGAAKIFRVFERGSAFTASAGKAIDTVATIAGELSQ